MKRMCLAVAVLAGVFGVHVRSARANNFVTFRGGPMKNLYVDLIFWGDFSDSDRQTAKNALFSVTNSLNGGTMGGFGREPAIHYYGVYGATPGMWLSDPDPISSTCPADYDFGPVVADAEGGAFGPAFDFNGNVASESGTLFAANRLELVVIKGTTDLCFDGGNHNGFHDVAGIRPWGAVRFEAGAAPLSHEIMEAMTDPYINHTDGWRADTGLTSLDEVADECATGSTLVAVTVDAPYMMSGINTQGPSCMIQIPESHAPMAAALEYGGMGTQPLVLVYLERGTGHIKSLNWPSGGLPVSGPFDEGQPSSTVFAAGKPSMIYSLSSGGQYIFVKGSDGAVWMKNNGTWTSLGGVIYGDPSVVLWTWNNGLWIHIAALGTDDKLWLQGIDNHGTLSGWGQLDLDGTLFVGPPNLVSRGANSLDLFATGEDGQIKWLRYANPNWSGPTTISHDFTLPIVSMPAVTRVGATGLELLAMSGIGPNAPGMWQTSYDGSSWSFFGQAFNTSLPTSDYMWGFEGTPAVVSGPGSGRVDVFSVARSGKLWWFWNASEPHGSNWRTYNAPLGGLNPPPLVSGGATGDPIALSRGTGAMEVFYRTDTGQLAHWTTTDTGAHWTNETVLPSFTIQ